MCSPCRPPTCQRPTAKSSLTTRRTTNLSLSTLSGRILSRHLVELPLATFSTTTAPTGRTSRKVPTTRY
uniref:Uncharacterized protein n=1 Tax=uncultured marine virus TaxID=186617 RepID=A0A0F7LA80_9VIRU|nr:hypothetical protein [uncultured marine virus]